MIEIPSNIFNEFNNIKFYDSSHTYISNNNIDVNKFTSVTTLLHDYVNDFNEISDYWSNKKSIIYNVEEYKILRAWEFINDKGTMFGSIIHNYMEHLFLNKIYEYPKNDVLNKFGFDPIYDDYIVSKSHCDNFYSDTFNKLIPIKTEYVICDIESYISGMIDVLFYNVKANEYQLWDYKTNKNFTNENKYGNKLKNDLFMLDECDLNIYSLQLGIYKYIIEKYINIKIGNMYLVWLSKNNENYKIIKCKDLSYYVNIIIENKKKSLI